MKQQARSVPIVVAVVLTLLLVGGLYYKFLGGGSNQQSDVASPYVKPFAMPAAHGSGRNSITGEPLPDRPGGPSIVGAPGAPAAPPGAKIPISGPSIPGGQTADH